MVYCDFFVTIAHTVKVFIKENARYSATLSTDTEWNITEYRLTDGNFRITAQGDNSRQIMISCELSTNLVLIQQLKADADGYITTGKLVCNVFIIVYEKIVFYQVR